MFSVEDYYHENLNQMRSETILQNVANEFLIEVDAIKSPSQYSKDATPRHVYFDFCMLFQYELSDKMEQCATLVNRDVTTLRAGAKRAQQLTRTDIEIARKFEIIKRNILK